MGIGSDSTPCARCELMAIGVLGEEINPAISKAICDVLSTKLSISDERWAMNQIYPCVQMVTLPPQAAASPTHNSDYKSTMYTHQEVDYCTRSN